MTRRMHSSKDKLKLCIFINSLVQRVTSILKAVIKLPPVASYAKIGRSILHVVFFFISKKKAWLVREYIKGE
jgi:hypothetical protein